MSQLFVTQISPLNPGGTVNFTGSVPPTFNGVALGTGGGGGGGSGTNGLSTGRARIYQRASSVPTLPSNDVTFTFAVASLTGLNNGWTVDIPPGTLPIYVSEASVVSTGASDTITPGEWATPVVLAQNGVDGLNSATVYLYQRTASASSPALPSASVTYTFSNGIASGINNGWSQTLPTTGGAYRWITQATALSSSPSDTLASGEWAPASLLAQDGVNGGTGPSGLSSAIIYIYTRSATTPTLPSATTTYTFATGALTGLNNGWVTSPPAGTNPLYVSVGTASNSGATDTIASGEWTSPVVLAQNGNVGDTGPAGLNAATVYLFQRTATTAPPSLPSSGVTYTFSTGAASGLTNGWSQSLPTTGGPYRWVTTGSAASTGVSDVIAPGEWAAAAILAQDGDTGLAGFSTGTVYIYRRLSSVPILPSVSTTYTFATGVLTGLNNGWTTTPPAGFDPLYVSVAAATSTGPFDTIAPGEWSSPVVLAQNGVNGDAGATGLNVATIYLFQRTTTSAAPALPSSTVTYTFSNGIATNVNNGWSQSLPTTGGAFRWLTTASAASTGTSDNIGPGEWASVALLAQDGSNGSAGTSTFVATIYRQASGTVAAPTGGTYNFSSSSLVPPSGWTESQPSSGIDPTYSVTQTFTTTTPSVTITGGAWSNLITVNPGSASSSGPVALLGNLYGSGFADGNGSPSASATGYVELRNTGAIWGNPDDGAGFQIGSWLLPNSSSSPPGVNYQVIWLFSGGDTVQSLPAIGTWGDFPTGTNAGGYVSITAGVGANGEVFRSASGTVQVRRKSDNVVVCNGTWTVDANAKNGVIQ